MSALASLVDPSDALIVHQAWGVRHKPDPRRQYLVAGEPGQVRFIGVFECDADEVPDRPAPPSQARYISYEARLANMRDYMAARRAGEPSKPHPFRARFEANADRVHAALEASGKMTTRQIRESTKTTRDVLWRIKPYLLERGRVRVEQVWIAGRLTDVWEAL